MTKTKYVILKDAIKQFYTLDDVECLELFDRSWFIKSECILVDNIYAFDYLESHKHLPFGEIITLDKDETLISKVFMLTVALPKDTKVIRMRSSKLGVIL